jgi:hypothetical protein
VSGYLQRLAANLIAPGGGIHPIVGSIYDTASHGVSNHALSDEQLIETRRRSPLETPPPAVPTFAPASKNEPPTPRETADAQPRSGVIAQREPYPRLLPLSERAGNDDDDRLRPAKVTDEAGRAGSSPSSANLAPLPAMRLNAPLVSGNLAPNPSGVFDRSANRDGLQRLAPPQRRSPQSVSPQRPSDEVEIHIGRIEVTALHPAPAPSAPSRPARRAMTLDEYLRRRDGRA